MQKSSIIPDQHNRKEKKRSDTEHSPLQRDAEEHSLKGTFVAVMILGGVMAVSWVGVFLLYLSRN